MFHSSPALRPASIPAVIAFTALATLSTGVAVVQPASAQSEMAPTSAPPVLTYKSALEGYRPFTDEKPIPWKEANETVRQRGGWQAYAKEAAGDGAAGIDPAKGAPDAPAAHQGHTMPMPPAKKEQKP
jgi:hypothetical protein